MLRTLAFILALGAPSLAMAEQFPASPLGQQVRGDDGTVIGRITAVERDADGNIIAVEIPGLEPADAPEERLVAERQRAPERPRVTRINAENAGGAANATVRSR
jgi:hypothetical protein